MTRNQIFLLIVYFFFNVNFTTANSKIFIKIQDTDESNPYRNIIIDKIDNPDSRTDDIELVDKALEIIKREKSGITAGKINKCLSTNYGNTNKKFECIKRLIYKGKTKNDDNKPYVYTNFFSKERIPYKYNYDNSFKDLTKSGNEHDSKRMFQTILNFSQDYLDINDLLRSNNEFTDEEPVDIKNVKSTELHIFNRIPFKNVNYLKRFTDFSQDYLDPDDLLKTNAKMDYETPKKMKNGKKLYIFKLIPSKNEVSSNDLRQFRNIPSKKELNDLRRFGNIVSKDFIKTKILRTDSIESDSTSSSEESKSEEEKVKNKDVKIKEKKGKKFQEIDKSGQDIPSEENISNESDIPIQRPIEIPKTEKKVYYMQAPNRILKIKNGRRRLPIFFPKRYHWDEEDMRHLQYHWFSGRQGKYWGQYKTPY